MSELGLFDAIFSTRSMRRLRPDPIPDAVLRQIIDAGIHAPSGSNFQNWGFVIVDRLDDKRFIRDHYLKHYRILERQGTIPPMAQIPLERQRMFASAIHLAEHMDEAPVILLACNGTDFPTYAQLGNPRSITATLHASIYPAVQNILLACRALGVGATLTTLHYFLKTNSKFDWAFHRTKKWQGSYRSATRSANSAVPRADPPRTSFTGDAGAGRALVEIKAGANSLAAGVADAAACYYLASAAATRPAGMDRVTSSTIRQIASSPSATSARERCV